MHPDVTARELAPAVAVLQLFLSSSKPVLRFAAVRTLNKVAMSHPVIASTCNIDMETLIADQVRTQPSCRSCCCLLACATSSVWFRHLLSVVSPHAQCVLAVLICSLQNSSIATFACTNLQVAAQRQVKLAYKLLWATVSSLSSFLLRPGSLRVRPLQGACASKSICVPVPTRQCCTNSSI
eukprot:scaffold54279_cov19-Tisochrysis_lutea.AAC.2